MSYLLLLLVVIVLCLDMNTGFKPFFPFSSVARRRQESHSQLSMVFDFLRKRTEEGFAQVQNIATKTAEGKLFEALSDSAEYVRQRRLIDSENLKRLTVGLARSRERLMSGLSSAFDDGSVNLDKRLEKIEEVLLQADIGAATTTAILSDLRTYAQRESLQVDDILPVLRARLVEALTPTGEGKGLQFAPVDSNEPTVIFVIGANGMGKTTTIGKIAGRLHNEGNLTVLLGACDTFRAAAVEQLGEWALRANVSIEKPTAEERGGDPVPVVTRSLRRAKEEKFDVVIIDTSGRLSNNFELTQQLQDMKAAIQKEIPSAPHETLLVVDGSMGRNAVEQASAWRKYVGVSGLAITKLDGTARGGFVVSVVRDLGLPIKFIGVGEKIDDLRDFDAETFVDALLGNDEAKAVQLKEKVNKMLNLSPAMALDNAASIDEKNKRKSSNSGSTSESARARLKASFGGGAEDSDDSEVGVGEGGAASSKPKRAKRPKPQALLNKKNKK